MGINLVTMLPKIVNTSISNPIIPIQRLNMIDLTKGELYGFTPANHVKPDKLVALEERLRAVKRFDIFDLVKVAEICLVLNIVLLKEFRISEFIKYTRMECPNMHRRLYCNKMAEVICNDKLLIHFFYYSLTSSIVISYMTIYNTRVKKWSDLTNIVLR